ncbi:MAG: hypothetical protein R3246_14165, partial [Acidimicrobiia bacterium]|nr:hypothetical protein [Acidimicrobiia bacterium]
GDTAWRLSENGAEQVADHTGPRLNCLLIDDDAVWVGAAEANLYRLQDGSLERCSSFDEVPGRDRWYTPWGGPPDVRSLAKGGNGYLYANVHVGGVVRSTNGGAGWSDTMDINADVHEITAHPSQAAAAYAAAAIGLGITADGADTWRFLTDGLHGTYCRAAAVTRRHVLFSASLGSRGSNAALYRTDHDGTAPAVKLGGGLPEWFSTNLDTACLSASGETAVAADPDGTIYVTTDEGSTWEVRASGLPPVRAVVIA